jgi:hypothetical protein
VVLALALSTWVQLIATAIAAAAAVASWATVVQSRRLLRESRLPSLHIEVSRVSGAGAVDGTMAVAILNAGDVLATRVGFIVATDNAFAQTSLPGGFLRPGDSAFFGSDLQISDNFQAVVYARSQDGDEYVWDHLGERRQLKPEGPLPTFEEIPGSFYPGVDFSGRRQAQLLRSA